MTTKAIAGKFATVEISSAIPPANPDTTGTWTELAEVTDIGQVPLSRNLIDVTYHSTDIWPNRIVGMANPSSIDLEMNFVHEQYSVLNELWDDEQTRWFRVVLRPTWQVLPGQKVWVILIEALVTDVSLTAPIDDRVLANITLAANGRVQYSEKTIV